MALRIIKNAAQRKQGRLLNILLHLRDLPKTSVAPIVNDYGDIVTIEVRHEQQFVPDFSLEWDSLREHYRVYIMVASTNHAKHHAGYCICTIGSGLSAIGFCTLYSFLHKYRANNKEAAYAS